MDKAQIFEKVKQVLKKHWWYFVLLIGSTVYVFIYKNDIYQFTELNTHNLIFLLWLVLLALPLFSEIEIGSVKLKKEVEKTRAEVKEAIGELKLQILDIKIANSNSNTFVVNNQPLPSKDELFHLQDSIESDTLSNQLENTKFKISEDNVYLFKVRLSLENQMSALCNMLQCSEHRSTYSMVQFLVHEEAIDRNTAGLIREVINIANRGVHGEIIDNDYVRFVKKTYPVIESALNTACNSLQKNRNQFTCP